MIPKPNKKQRDEMKRIEYIEIEQEQKKLLEEMIKKHYFTFETDESYQIPVKDWKVEKK